MYLTLLTAVLLKGQDTTVVYYDASWKKTSIENSVYYRTIYKKQKRKWISTDYNKDGSLRVRGEYSKRNLKIKNGTFIYYYENGYKKELSNFNNNTLTGAYQDWFDNGQTKNIGQYKDNDQSEEWITYFWNGQIDSKGHYYKGKTVGEWSWFYENGQMCASEKFNIGEAVSGKYWTEEGEPLDSIIANVAPVFAGGMDALNRFLNETVKYPKVAQNRGAYGKVFVQFVIEIDGSISNVKIVRSVDPDLDEESLRVVSLMPYWTPGKRHNKLVRVSYIVPISFKLYD